MLTCISQMELGLIATLALFHKLPSMKPISPDGTTGEGATLNPFSAALLVFRIIAFRIILGKKQ